MHTKTSSARYKYVTINKNIDSIRICGQNNFRVFLHSCIVITADMFMSVCITSVVTCCPGGFYNRFYFQFDTHSGWTEWTPKERSFRLLSLWATASTFACIVITADVYVLVDVRYVLCYMLSWWIISIVLTSNPFRTAGGRSGHRIRSQSGCYLLNLLKPTR